jgi:hypothetical protein
MEHGAWSIGVEWRRREAGRLISEPGSRLLGVVGDVGLVRSGTAWLAHQNGEGDGEEEVSSERQRRNRG